MRVLVFGKNGQLSTELERRSGVTALSQDQADLAEPSSCVAAIRAHSPAAVINAAAYTGVDKAEEEEALAAMINGTAPAEMAKTCADLGIPFVHVSTDYVFDGTGDVARAPDAPTAPLGAYGRTKQAGEIGVAAAGGAYAILRTSWVVSAHGANFVKTMLRVGPARGRLRIVDDQIGGPTPAADIASACLTVAAHLAEHPDAAGTYHFAGAPDTSWADFAEAIFDMAELDVEVERIPTTEYPLPAPRPLNSRLDCSSTETVFGIPRPDWRKGLADILNDLSRQGGLS